MLDRLKGLGAGYGTHSVAIMVLLLCGLHLIGALDVNAVLLALGVADANVQPKDALSGIVVALLASLLRRGSKNDPVSPKAKVAIADIVAKVARGAKPVLLLCVLMVMGCVSQEAKVTMQSLQKDFVTLAKSTQAAPVTPEEKAKGMDDVKKADLVKGLVSDMQANLNSVAEEIGAP